jgi:predicted GTPase
MRVAILGAAGRDFHNFITLYRDDPNVEVVAFTATQIPGIDSRNFPAVLAGPRYPHGIPIVPEADLERLALEEGVQQFVFSYSDVSWAHIGSISARANAVGADLVLPGARTMIPSKKPVMGIGAVRTGCGKSQTTRYFLDLLNARGLRAVGIRHPMPYGDLAAQAVQRFATWDDLVRHSCTIEEREEYEPYIKRGRVVYAGVDYPSILAAAERESDLILWDGGNNDIGFVKPDLYFVLLDPHRPGHARAYYPSEAQVRLADVLLIAKSRSATPEAIEAEKRMAAELNPRARILCVDSALTLLGHSESEIRGRRVVVVEDGPTTTHGGMAYGAGMLLARRAGAEIVDPRPWFVGEIAETYRKYPSIGALVPAMGYSPQQQADLQATLAAVPADIVVSGTPIELGNLIDPGKPILSVAYDLEEMPGEPSLAAILDHWLAKVGLGR